MYIMRIYKECFCKLTKKAFVSMSEALAAFARVSSDEFSWSPKLLVEHWTTLITQRSASIVLAHTLIIHSDMVHGTFIGMT